jgi:hypothetical protein
LPVQQWHFLHLPLSQMQIACVSLKQKTIRSR